MYPTSMPMNGTAPRELTALLDHGSAAARNGGWEHFVQIHSKLLLQVSRAMSNDQDAAMDHYAHVLEQLGSDDFGRLRAYSPGRDAKFTTWLAVVARRLCLDRFRKVYGRTRDRTTPDPAPDLRRKLVDLVAEELDVETYVPSTAASPEMHLRWRQLGESLTAVIRDLTERDQLLLRLRYQDELPIREIADLLDFGSIFPVYRRIKTLHADMKDALVARGVFDAEP
jgi:RNA polymerase sigma factor (sigma-70 family)